MKFAGWGRRSSESGYAPFYADDTAKIPAEGALEILECQGPELRDLVTSATPEREVLRCASGKWQHLEHLAWNRSALFPHLRYNRPADLLRGSKMKAADPSGEAIGLGTTHPDKKADMQASALHCVEGLLN